MRFQVIAAALAAIAAVPSSYACESPEDGFLCVALGCVGNGFPVPTLGLPLIKSFTLANFQLNFNGNSATVSSTNVEVDLTLPASLNSLLNIKFHGVGAHIGLGLPGAASVAHIDVDDYAPASGDLASNIHLNLNKARLTPDDPIGLAQLLKFITLASGPVPTRLTGYADNKAKSFFLDVCLRFVNFDLETSSLTGLGGLQQTTITALPTLLGGDAASGLKLSIPLSIKNPSNIGLNVNADVTLQLSFEGNVVGSVVLPNLSLVSGTNALTATAYVFPDGTNAAAVAAARKLVSQFVQGTSSSVTVGNGKAPAVPILGAALGALNIPQTLPANQQKLVEGTFVLISDTTVVVVNDTRVGYTASTLKAYNPFAVPVQIKHISATFDWTDADNATYRCGYIEADFNSFVIQPNSAATSGNFTTQLDVSIDACNNDFPLYLLSPNGTVVDIKSTITLDVGSFENKIDYSQQQVHIGPN